MDRKSSFKDMHACKNMHHLGVYLLSSCNDSTRQMTSYARIGLLEHSLTYTLSIHTWSVLMVITDPRTQQMKHDKTQIFPVNALFMHVSLTAYKNTGGSKEHNLVSSFCSPILCSFLSSSFKNFRHNIMLTDNNPSGSQSSSVGVSVLLLHIP